MICRHVSEFGRICNKIKDHDGLHESRDGVKWPTCPWGWSEDASSSPITTDPLTWG